MIFYKIEITSRFRHYKYIPMNEQDDFSNQKRNQQKKVIQLKLFFYAWLKSLI